MKTNNIFHALGAVGCILGMFGVTHYSIWPGIALLWIIASYFNAAYANNLKKQIEKLDSERKELIDNNIKLEGQLWDCEMKLGLANKK